MQHVGRCPRCGYALSYDGYTYRCGFCGYPSIRRRLVGSIRAIEKGLKMKVQNLLEAAKSTDFHQVVTYYPVTMRQLRSCIVCQGNIPFGIQKCPSCGAVQIVNPGNLPARSMDETQTFDRRVFDYIEAHDGTISLSQAARDLSMSLEGLRLAIERLKAAGLLNQA